VSNRGGGFGLRDIWFVKKNSEGVWGSPINIGKVINSSRDEDCVFAHPDGKTLYFSSKGHKGLGGYDVYKSVWNDALNTWMKPINLGKPINTKGDDIFYVETLDNKRAFYSSFDLSDKVKDRDIFEITLRPLKKESVKQIVEKKVKKFFLKGIVIDEQTKIPIDALVELYSQDSQIQVSQVHTSITDGSFQFAVDTSINYSIHVSAKGYNYFSLNFRTNNYLLDTSSVIIIEQNIFLHNISVGETFVMKNIYFDTNKSTLKPESKHELEKLMQFMNENSDVVIEVSGHTDNTGKRDYNKKLSENRALEVKNYLMAFGSIYSDRIEFTGYGDLKPISSNSTKSGREMNRRTEFKILKINK
jgi:outer membrane protein OmpA-like peptidoglycan-associated protein